jgi:formylglycine-generating enzyme required for sulfatase activity
MIASHPVVHVSWEDATAFAACTGRRLPSQEEWEKAARGTDGRRYPWGDWFEGRCNTEEANIGTTSPVVQFSLIGDSPYGCVDMSGNAFEWTASPSDKHYVLRGGSFNHGRNVAHCTSRVRHKPSYRFKNLGFRVADSRQD